MHRLKTIGFATGTTALLLTASVAFAEDRPMMGPPMSDGERTGEMRPRTMMASTTKAERAENGLRPTVASTTRANKQERLQEVRENAQARIEERHQKVAEHLADIKDKMKQQMAQRLAAQFDNTNTEWTDRFGGQLDRLDAIVLKIQDRAATAAAAGKDTTSTATALQVAKEAITTARTAVSAQAAMTYTVDTTTLPTTATSTDNGQEHIVQELRKSFKALHAGLFKDLKDLRDGAMKDARKAVEAAARTLGAGGEHATSTRPI